MNIFSSVCRIVKQHKIVIEASRLRKEEYVIAKELKLEQLRIEETSNYHIKMFSQHLLAERKHWEDDFERELDEVTGGRGFIGSFNDSVDYIAARAKNWRAFFEVKMSEVATAALLLEEPEMVLVDGCVRYTSGLKDFEPQGYTVSFANHEDYIPDIELYNASICLRDTGSVIPDSHQFAHKFKEYVAKADSSFDLDSDDIDITSMIDSPLDSTLSSGCDLRSSDYLSSSSDLSSSCGGSSFGSSSFHSDLSSNGFSTDSYDSNSFN